MRIVLIGAVEFSCRALEQLLANGANVVGVCTLERSSFNADHVDLSDLCAAHGVPWTYTPQINSPESIAWITDRQPDVVFCFGWSMLLKPELLRLAPLGVVGFHPAALPANRGRHPLIWALALGLTETASTFFFMDEGADSGDILSQWAIAIEPEDDARTLYDKMIEVALHQIDEFVPRLESGVFPRNPQDHARANVWRKRGRADGQIDWRMSAESVHNLVRALAKPYVGAHFVYRGADVTVWKTEIVGQIATNVEPGKVVAASDGRATVKCGTHAVRLVHTDPVFMPHVGEYL